ncbi:MAG TPA: hypothetical protein VKX46_15095 [Ktedonobacteraceae bacterium]|nr:hypothetical protein [Ktedonobacteraceae bacterium]
MTDDYTQAELLALYQDDARCIRILAACRRFAVKLGGASGNYATLAQNEEVLLRSFAMVQAAHLRPDGSLDPLFAQRCQRAGLTPAEVHTLQERARMLQQDDEEH